MELQVIKNRNSKIIDYIIEGRISKAFNLLEDMAYTSLNGKLISDMEELKQNYQNLLKYSFGYAQDPEREKIYISIKRKLLELTANVVSVHLAKNNDWISMLRVKDDSYFQLSDKEKSDLIDSLNLEREFDALLKSEDLDETVEPKDYTHYNESLSIIFDILWLTNNYGQGEIILSRKIVESEYIPWYDKSLIISAISLSLIRHFNIAKVELLFDFYQSTYRQVSKRALIGLVFSLLIYDKRLHVYPEVTNRIKSIENPRRFAKDIEQVLLQIFRAQETDKVTEKIQREIIPEVMKLKPEIEEKLRLDDLLKSENLEDKNPDWKDFFSESSDIYKKLEEFSIMQMDGSDVFMGAFSMLKRFGFFDTLTNWFLPFYKEHPEIKKSINDVDEKFDWMKFFEGIEQAPVMCNSDKYSFCFNIGFMPGMQKSMMLEMFNAELNSMKEIAEEDNKHNQEQTDRFIISQYIQDLYRFFKLFPKRQEFKDIFSMRVDLIHSSFINQALEKENLRRIAEFYFKKNYFNDALLIFEYLLQGKEDFELIEKIGFCYQKMGDYKKALEYYSRAEILETGSVWLHKKIGFCYSKTGNYIQAISYYKKIEKNEPDNLEVQAYLGQLNIDIEDYDTALKYYFKVEYLKPDLVKVQRPIAWCSFLLGKHEQALKYFKKVVETDSQRSDYLNLGHCYWVLNNLTEAISSYRMALKMAEGDTTWFANTLVKDKKYLKKFRITDLEVDLMVDYISFGL